MGTLRLASILGITLLSLSARAEQVVVLYPTYQGKPILAVTPRHDSPMGSTVDRTAHATCRLLGYYGAAYASATGNTINSYAYVVRPGTEVLNPLTVVANHMALPVNGFNVHYDGSGFTENPSPEFYRTPRNHRCLEMSHCRGTSPIDFRSDASWNYDRRHPFVRECGPWSVRDERSAAVFTSVTCESFPGDASHLASQVQSTWGFLSVPRMSNNDKKHLIQFQVNNYHEATGNRFRAQEGSFEQLGITLANQAQTCAQYGNAVQGTIVNPTRGQCNFQPYRAEWNQVLGRQRLSINTQVSFTQYLYDTGRITTGPKTGPACVRQILERYQNAVLPEEYGLGEARGISKPFCVNQVATARVNAGQCEFDVAVEDFLRVPTTLKISFGGDVSDNELQRRCDELATCFQHSTLSCANSGFCPAPGTVSRSTR